MKSTRKINISFPLVFNSDGKGFCYVDHLLLRGSCYAASEAVAKKKLAPVIRQHIEEALSDANKQIRTLIMTASGEVFLVQFRGGVWQYSISGPGRLSAGSTHGQFKNEKEILEAARKHAADFGGILWESRC